jgi:RNA polymerase sigma-70 factor (ECF subfamily)
MMNPEQIFEILMRENADMLLAYLRSAVRDEHAVDDLFQETMLVAWRKLEQYDRERPFGAWLRGIAGNLALAHFRERARQDQPLDEASLEWLEARFAQVHKLGGDTLGEKLSALRDCVQALPDEYRQPVQLRYSESLSLSEIGDSLQLATETLKKRLTRAKLRLADCLERKLAAAGELT